MKTSPITPPQRNQTPFGTPSTQIVTSAEVSILRHQKCGEETKDKFPVKETIKRASNPNVPEVMKWQKEEEEEGNEGGDELSQASAPSVETMVTHRVRSYSAEWTPRSPVGLGFLAKYGKPRRGDGRWTPEPSSESRMRHRIERLDRIVGRFDT